MWLLVNNIRIKFSDKQLTICLYFALWCYHAPPTGIWLVQTFVQLFVLCCVFLFLALSLKLWIKMLLLSANLSAILFFCYCFSRYLSIIFYFNFLHWFRLSALKKFQVFVLFGMNWHALCQSECRNFFMYRILLLLWCLEKLRMLDPTASFWFLTHWDTDGLSEWRVHLLFQGTEGTKHTAGSGTAIHSLFWKADLHGLLLENFQIWCQNV